MQRWNGIRGGSLAVALLLTCGLAGAQTTPSGQVVAPGTRGQKSGATPCGGVEVAATVANANDANCVEGGPGFTAPAVSPSAPERVRNVVALVRVDAMLPRPPVSLPEGDTFSVIGSATLVRVHRAELPDCLATGKRISARAGASTSTTCLDRKGELLAYQECRTGADDCVVLTPQDITKQQGSARTP